MYILYTSHQEHRNVGYVHLLALSIASTTYKNKLWIAMETFFWYTNDHSSTRYINNSKNLYLKKTLIFTKLIQMTLIFNIQVFSLKIDKFCKQTSLVCSCWQIVLRTLILYYEFWWNLFHRLILVTPFERHWPIQFHFNQIIPIRRFS